MSMAHEGVKVSHFQGTQFQEKYKLSKDHRVHVEAAFSSNSEDTQGRRRMQLAVARGQFMANGKGSFNSHMLLTCPSSQKQMQR